MKSKKTVRPSFLGNCFVGVKVYSHLPLQNCWREKARSARALFDNVYYVTVYKSVHLVCVVWRSEFFLRRVFKWLGILFQRIVHVGITVNILGGLESCFRVEILPLGRNKLVVPAKKRVFLPKWLLPPTRIPFQVLIFFK